jgi:hypothetical protein
MRASAVFVAIIGSFVTFSTAAPVPGSGSGLLTSAGSILGSSVGNPGSANKDNGNGNVRTGTFASSSLLWNGLANQQ